VFFLVTNFVIQVPPQERSMYIPTPKNEPGRAQIVLQYLDGNRVFWLDESISDVVSDIENNYGYLSSRNLRDRILATLLERNTITDVELDVKIQDLIVRADADPTSSFFILIRCPNSMPYFRVVDTMGKLTETKFLNIKYGCVAGTLEEIRNCRRISTVVERDDQGRQRKNIFIDFD
jgi:hypothetical protein